MHMGANTSRCWRGYAAGQGNDMWNDALRADMWNDMCVRGEWTRVVSGDCVLLPRERADACGTFSSRKSGRVSYGFTQFTGLHTTHRCTYTVPALS